MFKGIKSCLNNSNRHDVCVFLDGVLHLESHGASFLFEISMKKLVLTFKSVVEHFSAIMWSFNSSRVESGLQLLGGQILQCLKGMLKR